MAQIIEIPFYKVQPAEKFVSKKTKRCFGGVRIIESVYVINGQAILPNAVVLNDGNGNLAEDAGALIRFGYTDLVEVERDELSNALENVIKQL